MKNYFNIILIAAILLLLFPFLSLPELWENIYVSVLAFVVAYTLMLLRHKITIHDDLDEETSLQDYIKELKDRFQNQETTEPHSPATKRVSDISLDEK